MIGRRQHRRVGLAMIAALSVLAFVAVLSSIVLRTTVYRNRYLRDRGLEARAVCLADSAAREAMHIIATGGSATELTRTLDQDTCLATWTRDADGAYDITATGIARTGAFVSDPQTVRIRIALSPAGAARILSWQPADSPPIEREPDWML